DDQECESICGPHEGGIAAHVEEVLQVFHVLTTLRWVPMASRIQLAARSRASTSACSRVRVNARNRNVNPPNMTNIGPYIDAGMAACPSFMTDGAWCSEFHQMTEKCTIGTLTTPT